MIEYGIEWKKLDTHEEHLSVIDYKKQERQKELDQINISLDEVKQKQIDLERIDSINISKSIFGNKVTMPQADYQYLMDAAQKYVVEEQRTITLQNMWADANKTIGRQDERISELDEKAQMLSIDNTVLDNEIQGLEKENFRLKRFIEHQGLKDLYIEQSRKCHDMER